MLTLALLAVSMRNYIQQNCAHRGAMVNLLLVILFTFATYLWNVEHPKTFLALCCCCLKCAAVIKFRISIRLPKYKNFMRSEMTVQLNQTKANCNFLFNLRFGWHCRCFHNQGFTHIWVPDK